MTQSTEQERAEFTDGAWYWVEKERWNGEEPLIAPAMYKADADAWYSREFAGISTRYLKVLEPCVRNEQAARRAQVVPQGWRLVPIDPTPEMIDAADAVDGEYSRRAFGGAIHMPQSGEDHWHAMLAAAPQPPEKSNSVEFHQIKQAAPVQMPEPAFYADDRGYEVSAEWLASDEATSDYRAVYIDPRYTEHQVRELLARK